MRWSSANSTFIIGSLRVRQKCRTGGIIAGRSKSVQPNFPRRRIGCGGVGRGFGGRVSGVTVVGRLRLKRDGEGDAGAGARVAVDGQAPPQMLETGADAEQAEPAGGAVGLRQVGAEALGFEAAAV